MLRIQFSTEFIESALRTGAVHEKSEIVDGIPKGHVLVDAKLVNGYRRVLELTFAPIEEQRKAIVVKTIRREEESEPCTQP